MNWTNIPKFSLFNFMLFFLFQGYHSFIFNTLYHIIKLMSSKKPNLSTGFIKALLASLLLSLNFNQGDAEGSFLTRRQYSSHLINLGYTSIAETLCLTLVHFTDASVLPPLKKKGPILITVLVSICSITGHLSLTPHYATYLKVLLCQNHGLQRLRTH